MARFVGKVAIITGSSSGLGASTAVAFAKEGAKIAIHGRNKERLSKTAKACREAGAQMVIEIAADVSEISDLEKIVSQTVENFGQIDILVNNAGTIALGEVSDLDLATYERIFKINVRAPVFLSKFALPHLKKTKGMLAGYGLYQPLRSFAPWRFGTVEESPPEGSQTTVDSFMAIMRDAFFLDFCFEFVFPGCVVNISSVWARKVQPFAVAHSMTKCALDHFTRGFAAECASFGVRVNSINPGVIDKGVEMDLSQMPAGKDKDAAMTVWKSFSEAQKLGHIPLGVLTDSILFLCSSTHITGISLPVDGGFLVY